MLMKLKCRKNQNKHPKKLQKKNETKEGYVKKKKLTSISKLRW